MLYLLLLFLLSDNEMRTRVQFGSSSFLLILHIRCFYSTTLHQTCGEVPSFWRSTTGGRRPISINIGGVGVGVLGAGRSIGPSSYSYLAIAIASYNSHSGSSSSSSSSRNSNINKNSNVSRSSNNKGGIKNSSTQALSDHQAFEILDHKTTHSCTMSVKRSKFTAIVGYAANIDRALEFVAEHLDADASHNCWAFRGGSPSYERYSDDGEVSGSAGRPILLAISSERLVNCVVVVIRNYGGVNLGRGGLFRAYYGSARAAASEIDKKPL